MAPPKENRPPRNLPPKSDVGVKRRKVPGSEGPARGAVPGRGRKQDDGASAESSESAAVELTKERVLEMVNDEPKLKQFDTKVNYDRITRYSKNLKVCVKWFQKEDENHVQEEERMRTELAALEAKCATIEEEMKMKEKELNAIILELREHKTSLQEKLIKEESEKQDALGCYEREKSTRIAAEKMRASLSEELEKANQEKSAANQQIASLKDMEKGWKEYNTSLRQHMSKLEADLNTASESLKKLEKEKLAILENLSTLRVHNSTLQDQLDASKSSQDEAVKHQNALEIEVRCLRGELQQVRDDRDRQVSQVETLKGELVKYREITGKSCAEMDNLTTKVIAMEELQSSQREQISLLQHQLAAANEKLKMANLSDSERAMESEKQRKTISELQDRLAKTELQVVEGESLRKKLHNTILELKGNIRVFCRVRPFLPDDGDMTEAPLISYPTSADALGRGVDLTQNGQKYAFTFDKVFDHEAAQQDVFVEISQLVQSALDGYKVCIFAYGQTGAGKTYTMMGRPDVMEQKGLIPRSLEQIFRTSQSLAAQGWKYNLQVSMLEIYNESIRDLLLANRPISLEARTENVALGKQYSIKHDANGNTHVSDLTIVDVCSLSEISSLLQQASKSRSVGKTQMNEQSSRSHFVFTLRISGFNEHTEQQVQGVLNLIDLAGSERLSRSGATGDRLKETQAINKSLSCLSDVIFALAKKEEHIPFRNSKLTYLLQPCLGGDSKTLMFVNVSPDPTSVGESLCSLRFAARVNACEIGVPRRQTTSRSDSRLICG